MTTSAVTPVGTPATRIHRAVGRSGRYHQSVHVSNPDSVADVFLGAAGVTATTGFPLRAKESVTLDPLAAGEELFAVTAAGTINVGVVALPVKG